MQRFQVLNDPRFHLVYNVQSRFLEAPSPKHVRLNRIDMCVVEGLKKKSIVHPHMLLATHPSPSKGDLHSPIHGVITDITHRSIFISAIEPAEDAPMVEPIDLLGLGLEGEELALQVKQLGVNTRSLRKKAKTLIINGLNPEPGITWAEPMLNAHIRSLRIGMELHKRIAQADKVVLAVPQGIQVAYDGIEIIHVDAKYPTSIDKLLIREITGQENPEDYSAMSLHNIWSLGRVGFLGTPLIDTVLTIGSGKCCNNYIAKHGTTIGELFESAEVTVEEGDTVFRGGPLRGESVDSLDRSITKGTMGLFVLEQSAVPPMEGHSPCVNCGACVQVCPARLNPHNLSRHAEFAQYDKCRAEQSHLCLDCGLCGYVCIARRPVLQYIHLANEKIRQEDANRLTLEPLTPVVDF